MFYIVNDNTQEIINKYQTKDDAKKDLLYFIIFAKSKDNGLIHFSIKEDREIAKKSIS